MVNQALNGHKSTQLFFNKYLVGAGRRATPSFQGNFSHQVDCLNGWCEVVSTITTTIPNM